MVNHQTYWPTEAACPSPFKVVGLSNWPFYRCCHDVTAIVYRLFTQRYNYFVCRISIQFLYLLDNLVIILHHHAQVFKQPQPKTPHSDVQH